MKEPMSGSSSAIRIRAIVPSVGRVSRDDDRELRSLADSAFELDATAVRFGDRLDDRQAEAAAAVAAMRAFAAREPMEDAALLRGRDAEAGVPHPQTDLTLVERETDGHRVVGQRVLDGVVRQVHHPFGQAVAVRIEDAVAGAVVELPSS